MRQAFTGGVSPSASSSANASARGGRVDSQSDRTFNFQRVNGLKGFEVAGIAAAVAVAVIVLPKLLK